MSKPYTSTKTVATLLLRLHQHRYNSTPTLSRTFHSSSSSHRTVSDGLPRLLPSSSTVRSTSTLSPLNPSHHCKRFDFHNSYYHLNSMRHFASIFGKRWSNNIKTSSSGSKASASFARKVVENPTKAVNSVFSSYREAIGLHVSAFLRRNSLFLFGAGGIVVCALLWRIMFGIANTFVGLSEGMAKYGFLALSSSIVAFAGLYIRSRYTINPDKVYRIAMRKLNTSAGILEVMGAPLTGTELRAYVMSGGGFKLNNLKPRLSSKRCFLIFPVQGSERKGLVSVEVKKKKGQYDMRLLAVDIPMASGPDQRLYLIGDEEEYKVGGGLIAELRDPVVKAMAASKEFDDLDEIEEEEDAERALQEAERKHREELEKLEKSGGS